MEKQGFFSRLASWGPFGAINSSIRNKLLTALLTLALVPLIIAGVIAYQTARTSLLDEAFAKLEAVETIKANQLQSFFESRRADVKAFPQGATFYNALKNLSAAMKELGAEQVRALYVGKPELSDAGDGSAYSQVHASAGSVMASRVTLYQYDDLFLIDLEGQVVYSAAKDDDFGTNLVSGPYKDTGLGRGFQQTLATLQGGAARDYTQIEDYSFYAPSGGKPAAFVFGPVYDQGLTGDLIGLIALQLSNQSVAALLSDRTGLGETGETYLVGEDKLWRSDSRFAQELGVASTLLNPDLKVDTEASRGGLAGEHGVKLVKDYRGVNVLSAWSPMDLQPPSATDPDGVHWVIIAETDQAEVEQPVVQLAYVVGGVTAGAAVLVIIVGFVLAAGLTNQVNKITDLFGEIGIGNFEARAAVVSSDELGVMASSLNAMLDNTLTLIQSREERDSIQASIMKLLEEVSGVADGDLRVEAEVTADMMGAIADAFNTMINELRRIISNVQEATLQVSSSANEIQATAEHLAQGSETQAVQISDSSAAIEEMSVSIQQVSENATLSATVGDQSLSNAHQGAKAVQATIEGMGRIREQVQETSKRIKRLGESSQEIGEIVQLIDDIADRTSILALNASIQAAMAGDAGRGFAVVAEEVERLAERSAEATKQIATLIRTIQSETNEAVAAMEATTREVVEGSQLANEAGKTLAEIETVTMRLDELIQSISMASKQQARGSETLAKSMSEISEVTQQTAAGTKQAAVSINNLAVLADELRSSVSQFKLPDKS